MYGTSRSHPKRIAEGDCTVGSALSLLRAAEMPALRSAARIFLPAFPWSSVGRVARWAAGMPFSLSHCPRALGFGVGVMWRLQNCLPCLRGGSREDTGGSVFGAFLGSVRDVHLVTAIRICLLGLLIPALTGAKVRITPWVRILCDACSRQHRWRLISRGVQRRLFGWCQ